MSQIGARAIAQRNLVFRFPVVGTLLRDAIFGHEDAKYYFIANVLITLFWTVFLYGYPAMIVIALAGAACGLAAIVTLTALDLFENRRRRPARTVSALKYRPEKK